MTTKRIQRHGALVLLMPNGNDQRVFRGTLFGDCDRASTEPCGEVVFQTGMVGYPESLTDPSYSEQILVLTYPLIGNYGVPDTNAVDKYDLPLHVESKKVHVKALVVGEYVNHPSHHHESQQTLDAWLKHERVLGIEGIDTRVVTMLIREHGTLTGYLVATPDCQGIVPVPKNIVSTTSLSSRSLASQVSRTSVDVFHSGKANGPRVMVIDCGVKMSQLRHLLCKPSRQGGKPRHTTLVVVGIEADFESLFDKHKCTHLFISNGPGDPRNNVTFIKRLSAFLNSHPDVVIFGICLGHQLLALAAGHSVRKMKYGNRGHNIPCQQVGTTRTYITTQNHGYEVVLKDVVNEKDVWNPLYVNLNDQSNEGLYRGHTTTTKQAPLFSVQFHPEAKAGPEDTTFLFDVFLNAKPSHAFLPLLATHVEKQWHANTSPSKVNTSAPKKTYHKVLVLGSGGLKIAQSGEFDYSGAQAAKAYKKEGLCTVFVNANIANVQTTPGHVDKVYCLPVTPEFVEKVIQVERPDCIALSFGGQTALNCGALLHKMGLLKKYNIDVLGTPIESILLTEDRDLFKKHIQQMGEHILNGDVATSWQEAHIIATRLGYPIFVRSAFTLGGQGSGTAQNESELKTLVTHALAHAKQVILDKSLRGWKEIEYEIVRDASGIGIINCNMENFDPVGVHTGESIVIAPSQTLSNDEYMMLRDVGLRVAQSLNIVGECNIQYALHPQSKQYYIIEVNARLSRSSALASKATGYPLAYIAAKLGLGYRLDELKNNITGVTTACFEPSLDYCVVKVPRWDLKKFDRVDKHIGSAMKSVGEGMAISRSFEEALQSALRMTGMCPYGLLPNIVSYTEDTMRAPTYKRILAVATGLATAEGKGEDAAKRRLFDIHQLSGIDMWFLYKIQGMVRAYQSIRPENASSLPLLKLKRLGYSDAAIARAAGVTELVVREQRLKLGVRPDVKKIDTVAAEFPCRTNYLYATYATPPQKERLSLQSKDESDNLFAKLQNSTVVNPVVLKSSQPRTVVVVCGGVYKIGNSVEFDWSSVSCMRQLRKMGIRVIVINCNPETVSTDYDEADMLYFSEISFENVMNIVQREQPDGVVLSVGGQLANNIAMALHLQNVPVVGTSAENIDRAENRHKFSRMLSELHIDQPQWCKLTSVDDAKTWCQRVGYPCLVRPSYVLSGAAMNVAYSPDDLKRFLGAAVNVSPEHPVVLSKFIGGAKEIEVDAIACKGRVKLMAVSEHIENAGVHSGDATLVFPAQYLTHATRQAVHKSTYAIAKALQIHGPFNIQFMAKDNYVKVIECNLRASRSLPFVSKTLGINMIAKATAMWFDPKGVSWPKHPAFRGTKDTLTRHIGVKVPQFSFNRLQGADILLGVEMQSTGEVACFGTSVEQAYLKAVLATGMNLPRLKGTILLSIGGIKFKREFRPTVDKLKALGYTLCATRNTADYYGVQEMRLTSSKSGHHTILHWLRERRFDMVINITERNKMRCVEDATTDGYRLRRAAIDANVPVLTNIKVATLFVRALARYPTSQALANTVSNTVDCLTKHKLVRLPGLIDVHVHVREPGEETKEDWSTCTKAALAGGVTMICAMPNTKPALTDAKNYALVNKLAADKSHCDYALYAGASTSNVQNVATTLDTLCAGLKLYLNHTHDNALRLNSLLDWSAHLKAWQHPHHPIVVHAEGQTLAAVLFLASIHKRRIHVAHVARKEEILLIKEAKAKGMDVTCEVAPHHLFLTANKKDAFKKVKPPLMTRNDQKALWDNLDSIDCFATDHAPHLKQDKLEKGCPGFPGLETALPLLLTAVAEKRLTLDDIILRYHTNPKRIFNLPDQPDTYVEVDMHARYTLPSKMQYSKAGWTPFAGRSCVGAVKRVVLRGQTVYLSEKPTVGHIFTPHAVKNVRHTATPLKTPTTAAPLQLVSPKPLSLKKTPFKKTLTTLFATLMPRHVLSVCQWNKELLHNIFQRTTKYRRLKQCPPVLKDKRIGLLFYEASSRTRLSFESAITMLGGTPVYVHTHTSSVKKGESFEDTVRTFVACARVDALIIRHPQVGSADKAARVSPVPVINAGDGQGEHPTQTLVDLYTIRHELGTLGGQCVLLVGDLKHGRTVHSLAQALAFRSDVRLYYVVPDEAFDMPQWVKDRVSKNNVSQTTVVATTLPPALVAKADVIYMTRLQRERLSPQLQEIAYKKPLLGLGANTLAQAKERMLVLHPLPRGPEIAIEIDSDPRTAYMRQMAHGPFVRAALLSFLFPEP